MPLRLKLVLLSVISLHSCAMLNTNPASLNKDIKVWLAQNEFDKIDSATRKIDQTPQYKNINSQLTFIKSRKKYFIEDTISRAKKHQQENNWQLALDVYNDALKKINNETMIVKERSKLIFERDRQVGKLGKEMLIQRANALISYKKIYLKLNELIPNDYSARFDINRYDKDRVDVAQQLNTCGDLAMKKTQPIQARNCYSLSNKLAPSDRKKTLVTHIEHQLKQKTQLTRNNNLLSAYKIAYKNNDYRKAKRQLTTLLAVNPTHTKAKTLMRSLNVEIEKIINKKIQLGETLYNEKKINDALRTWQNALRLEPNNKELIRLINRAEKVSKNIQNLQLHQ